MTLATATNLLQLDTLLLGGGMADACKAAEIDLVQGLSPLLPDYLLPGISTPEIVVIEAGNQTILDGALALAEGDQVAEPSRFRRGFSALATEQTGARPPLEKLCAEEIAFALAEDEASAALRFQEVAPLLAQGGSLIVKSLRRGGRIIYLGAGTSGRIGALDAVEIPCTFGLADDRFIAVIAGGSADAALTIEEQGEEDISSVAELFLLNLRPEDLLIGLSASGTAFFVRSGLAYARYRGATTLFLHENPLEEALADLSIPLRSGPEAIAGSTRMKAGTATKKALNLLSTTAMVLLGKVREGEMIDLHCCNAKLEERALRILMKLAQLPREEARHRLAAGNYDLRKALDG